MYAKFFKRLFDFILSFFALVILSPLLLILTVIGAIAMRGNPFFVQERPGKNEKIFKMIKFRTMDDSRDEKGELLPDEQRLNKYGIWLRKTSCDELLELVNIVKGDMSIVGPRPLLIRYLPFYTEDEHHRHDVRPGLTGLAQINGRNTLNWDERLGMDIKYVEDISLTNDCKIVLSTIIKVIKKSDIASGKQLIIEDLDVERGKIH